MDNRKKKRFHRWKPKKELSLLMREGYFLLKRTKWTETSK